MPYYEDPNIFLTYANTPLANSPAGLLKTLEVIQKARKMAGVFDAKLHEYTKKAINMMTKINDDYFSSEEKKKRRIEELYELERSRRLFCTHSWSYPIDYEWNIKAKDTGWQTLKTHEYLPKIAGGHSEILEAWERTEREHHLFRFYLDEIILGKKISEIKSTYYPTFKELISDMPQNLIVFELVKDDKNPFKETIKRIEGPDSTKIDIARKHIPRVLYGAPTKSFICFLADNDRRKLKKCPVCQKYFIAKDAKRKVCYPPRDCEKKAKTIRQRDIMRRKRDKNGPDFDPKYL